MDAHSVWQDTYRVTVYEADALGRASIAALANYVQNSAANHYNTVDRERGPLLPAHQIWMMTRMELRVEKMPRWQDEIVVETWSRGLDKVSAVREFTIRDASGGIAGLGTTLWVVIDRTTRRLQRLTELAPKWPSLPERTFINKTPDKVEELQSATRGPAFKAVYSDLDVNRHVNNVKYLQWMLDTYSQSFLEKRDLSRIEVNFLDSASAGDEIVIGTQRADGAFLNNVIRTRDDREICRARLEFGPERT